MLVVKSGSGQFKKKYIFLVTKSASAKEKAVFFTLNRVLDARELLAVEDCCLTHLDKDDIDDFCITA